jgi:hypothetical protein
MLDMSITVWLLFLPAYYGINQAPTSYLTAENCQKVAKELGESELHVFGKGKPKCIQARIYK